MVNLINVSLDIFNKATISVLELIDLRSVGFLFFDSTRKIYDISRVGDQIDLSPHEGKAE